MYAQNNPNQIAQHLADYISNQANSGPIQLAIWQMASHNNYQNEYFQQMVATATEVIQYWGSGGQQVDLGQVISTVYFCKAGMHLARYPQLAQQISQQDYNNWMSWAQQAQGLSAELSQFQARFQQQQPQYPGPQYGAPQYGQAAPRQQHVPQNPWDAAQAQQQGGWGTPPPAARPMYGANSNASFATPASHAAPQHAAPARQQPAPYGPRSGGNTAAEGMRSRYGRNQTQQAPAQQPASRPVLQVTSSGNNQPPQFTQPRKGAWRSRNNTSEETRFNPDDPKHAPVGREVAEAHENAANARASWATSDHDWDNDNTIGFHEEMEPAPQETVSTVRQNHSKEPQFMERLSSNPDVPNLLYGHDTENGYFEFTIEDWRKQPDPDFPWEIGYTPATRTRRIAYDVKRKCFIQVIEENDVKFDDHSVVDKSAAVRNTAATRARPPRDVVDVEQTTLVTVNDLTQNRQKIIDTRLDAAKESWEHQEQKARDAAKESGNYVAPELTPSREEVIDTPLDSETDEDTLTAMGRLTAAQMVLVDLATESQPDEAHALYAAQSQLVNADLDATDAPVIITKYVETTPFMLNEDEAETALAKLKPLVAGSELKNMVQVATYLNGLVDDIPTLLWNAIDDQLTTHTNSVLTTELGLEGLTIDSFAEDGPALPEYLRKNKAAKFMEALSRHINEFMTPMFCVSLPKGDDAVSGRTVLLRRESVLAKIDSTSQELGIYADKSEFVITASSAPNIHNLIKHIVEKSAREDGKAGYHKRVLLLEDGVRFTIHQGWMGDESVFILKR